MESTHSDASKPRLLTGQALPALRLRTVTGAVWDLAERRGRFVLLVVYRGLHCDPCRQHLRELASLAGEFAAQSVDILAVSCDTRARAEEAASQWGLQGVPLAYGLAIDSMLAWGLPLSPGRGRSGTGLVEPPLFAEPALFLVRADGTLAAAAVGPNSFSRPRLRELLRALPLLLRQRKTILPAE